MNAIRNLPPVLTGADTGASHSHKCARCARMWTDPAQGCTEPRQTVCAACTRKKG